MSWQALLPFSSWDLWWYSMKYYAGIGSRETPKDILEVMTRFAGYAESKYLTLRSGHAGGADLAFERGVHNAGMMQIFLPWNGFNGAYGNQTGYTVGFKTPAIEAQAEKLAEQLHPAWDMCSQGARKMHTRNMAQILGPDLNTPVEFVVCWTLNASGAGGTGQALRLAHHLQIPVFDLGGDLMAVCHALKDYTDRL